jgi:hypothetical protein
VFEIVGFSLDLACSVLPEQLYISVQDFGVLDLKNGSISISFPLSTLHTIQCDAFHEDLIKWLELQIGGHCLIQYHCLISTVQYPFGGSHEDFLLDGLGAI